MAGLFLPKASLEPWAGAFYSITTVKVFGQSQANYWGKLSKQLSMESRPNSTSLEQKRAQPSRKRLCDRKSSKRLRLKIRPILAFSRMGSPD
jgi:hypothetical protein